ncbi:MAG TPA: shikimate dehydrogenase [Spirochaetes bacterium]|nr:shikimate dehydrogenase [Spirochaetota bacterium]
MNINSVTGLIGLYGHPVEHSLSPFFINFALKRLELNFLYLAFDIESRFLKEAACSMRALGLKGVNVTIPHKRSVMEHLDNIHDDAAAVGAVNCIINRNGKLHGRNTDFLGFIEPLKNRNILIKGTSACLVGCGGAARSVLYALVKEGVGRIYLMNRTEKNAKDFIEWSMKNLSFDNITYSGGPETASCSNLSGVQLLVNTIPLGMFPNVDACPLPVDFSFSGVTTVYDLVYNPWKTELLKRAGNGGAQTINGFEMLIIQGLYSLSYWFPDRKKEIFKMMETIIDYAAGILKNFNNI